MYFKNGHFGRYTDQEETFKRQKLSLKINCFLINPKNNNKEEVRQN